MSKKYFFISLKYISKWLLSTKPQGIGTLLIGLAAGWALFKTDAVINEVLKVQKQAEKIETAVNELRLMNRQMSSSYTAATRSNEQLQRALEDYSNLKENSSTYIPKEKIDSIYKKMIQTNDRFERAKILENAFNKNAQ